MAHGTGAPTVTREGDHFQVVLPVGGTDDFTTIRIGNYALRMIDDGITELKSRG